jgi:hypothetical protein
MGRDVVPQGKGHDMNRSRVLGFVLVSAALVSLLALSGCGFLAQKAVEGATGVKIDKGNGTVSVQGKDGSSATLQQGKIPDGFPADFAVYAGTVKMGNRVQSPDGALYQVTIETPDNPTTVADWYAEKLKAAGWTIDNRNDANSNGKAVSTIIAKKDKQQAMIIAGTQSDGNLTEVNISIQSKP